MHVAPRPCARLSAAVLVCCLAIPAAAQDRAVAPPLPPPGDLVDLGGWHLHLHCMGEVDPARPTVVLESGAGGFSVDWSLVQPEVARFVRVCSYDRAGLGWSDLGPHPRTMGQLVWELHALLRHARVQPPYVLVGQSYGGLLARLFTLEHREEVAGLVLVESLHEEGMRAQRDGTIVRLIETAGDRPVPDVRSAEPLRTSDLAAPVRSRLEAAAAFMPEHANRSPYDKLPPDAQRMRAWAFGQIEHWAANDNPHEAEEVAALLARQRTGDPPFGDLPLVVLSRGIPEPEGPPGAGTEEEHAREQADLATRSRTGTHVIATRSGHAIMIDEPEVVVAAIREVVAGARRR